MRACQRCKRKLPLKRFSGTQRWCKGCYNTWRRGRRQELAEDTRRVVYDQNLRRAYGITVEEYEAILDAQGDVCALCDSPSSGTNRDGSPRRLHVDHDHETGGVRSLLCSPCNQLVAWVERLERDPWSGVRAKRYLDGWSRSPRSLAG